MSSQSLLGLPPTTHELKSLVPFLQRAHEVREQQPIIAYWCAYYAAQQGIVVQAKDASSRQLLFSLLDLLEKMKKEIGPTDAIDNEAASCAYVENFALRVFSLADNEDRKGNATRATARTFLAASNFLEILKVFPKTEVSDSIDEKIRYAKWKAADIAKAFREGRTPVPGPQAAPEPEPAAEELGTSEPPANEQVSSAAAHADETVSQARTPRTAWVSEELEGWPSPAPVTPPSAPPDIDVFPPTPSFPPEVEPVQDVAATAPPEATDPHLPRCHQPPPPPPPYAPPAAGFRPPPPPPMPVHVPVSAPSGELPPSLIVKIQKHCRFAISSLDYEDAEQARRELRAALELLGG